MARNKVKKNCVGKIKSKKGIKTVHGQLNRVKLKN